MELTGATQSKTRRAAGLLLEINGYVFETSFVTYLVLLIAEKVRAGSVTFFFDPNIIFYLCLVSGVFKILTLSFVDHDIPASRYMMTSKRWPLPVTAAILAGLLTYHFMSGYGGYIYVIVPAAALLIGVACFSIPAIGTGD